MRDDEAIANIWDCFAPGVYTEQSEVVARNDGHHRATSGGYNCYKIFNKGI